MTNLEPLCQRIYSETRARFGARPLGFRVLYGPPVYRPPVFFIGYQPGGGPKRKDAHLQEVQMQGYPDEFDYASGKWLLARRAQDIWGTDLLQRCCGSNLIFPRAETKKNWRATTDAEFRLSAEAFGREKLQQLIDAMQPEKLVVIGTTTLRELEKAEVNLTSPKKARTLIRRGEVFGFEAEAVIHLSGAHISTGDLALIRDHFNS